jgi:hypothetical protein
MIYFLYGGTGIADIVARMALARESLSPVFPGYLHR